MPSATSSATILKVPGWLRGHAVEEKAVPTMSPDSLVPSGDAEVPSGTGSVCKVPSRYTSGVRVAKS
ncbi:hypothetical protein C8D88_111172 [Lentzea atacamensis]|uniref:Uncharacterized protein n=2 Tax=Lentzea TaxID=165301 RepID=A0A316HRJ7_9PSEU|nr:hypothetical protein C8D88_111172 [Lentzea atacamensis]